nr:sulfatase-like hydrolase/transferase [Bacteroidota bacterium]
MFDDKVIEPLKQVLLEDAKNKFIVIHLMGTHFNYSNRYPPEYDIFKTKPVTKFKHDLAYKTINEYDNAMLYNDYIINSIIDEVSRTDTESFIIYFSDHGEDVYETLNAANHYEANGTKPMFDIPFILWLSENYKSTENSFVWDTERKYSLESIIHTIADLSNITFAGYNPDESIVNPSFKEINRNILNGKYYEEVFNEE